MNRSSSHMHKIKNKSPKVFYLQEHLSIYLKYINIFYYVCGDSNICTGGQVYEDIGKVLAMRMLLTMLKVEDGHT